MFAETARDGWTGSCCGANRATVGVAGNSSPFVKREGISVAQRHSTGRYRDSRVVQVGVGGLVLGSGPLLLAVVISHLKGDPNPNPVGPGILCGLTLWPSLICLAIGLIKVSLQKKTSTRVNPGAR
jgi:hypothetical protein